MRLMTFVNPSFHKGRNCTIRRGKFWSCLKKGEEIGLVRSLGNSKERIVAVIEEVKVLRYRELREEGIQNHHSKKGKEELLKEMKGIHKGKGKNKGKDKGSKGRIRPFSANEAVTVVYFVVRSRAYITPYGKLIYIKDRE